MTVKICPECEAENPASEVICTQCAYPLEAVDTQQAPDAGPTCSNCGKAVSANMKFCDGCGANLTQPQVSPPPIPDPVPDSGVAGTSAPTTGPEPDTASDAGEPPPPTVTTTDDGLEPVVSMDQDWKLSVVEGFSIGKEYLLFKDEMLLGRLDPESDIYPDIDLEDQDDGFVSRRHAIVRKREGVVTIEDCGGENGTTIDRKRIPANKPFPLNEGQVVRIGKVGLMLKLHKKS